MLLQKQFFGHESVMMLSKELLYISRSNISTEINKTGSWRFLTPIYQLKSSPCTEKCPLSQDISRIEMLVSKGKFKEAIDLILLENPFPSVCGHVCFHTCETACNRKSFDEPVGIHSIERFLGNIAIAEDYKLNIPIISFNGKNIAILGAGPSGLGAAYFMRILGYNCDVFEIKKEPGGLLRWGIPAYRLPDLVLRKEILRIESLGVKIHCNSKETVDSLKKSGKYDAIFIGCGYGKPVKMGIDGEDLAIDGLEFLYKIRNGENTDIGGHVAVIGGGNSAIDVSRSLIRIGATPIIFYRRRIEDMPAFKEEVEAANVEGVEIRELTKPIRIEKDSEGLVITLNNNNTFKAQHVIKAIGNEAENHWKLLLDSKENFSKFSRTVLVNNHLPIVLGGDLVNPVKSVADAIASGKQAAMVLDSFFNHREVTNSMDIYTGGDRKNRSKHITSIEEINLDYFEFSPRRDSEIEEAKRCFNCGICNDCDNCRIFCPEISVNFKDNKRSINLDYCKGCGICITECPRNAMGLREEA
ncbi:MAG: FAD-dependent oxidoreductase [Desulfobacterales bacterium]|nr:FAD-dependent oxidoreductase [Desulfobacterales bacterium]MBF0395678.1 FAD-dependent oxidoreductase [Desulfobacterales bacterium]